MENEPKIENINEALKQEILVMVEEDQRIGIDRKNAERMKEIIKEYGWPRKSMVGEEAANGAWLLVQHADHDVEFQKQALELLREAVVKGEAEKSNEAYLTDRVRVNTGQPQIFGTQFYEDAEGKFGPRPIEDIKQVEERRKEFGLEPFSEYEQVMQEKNREFEEKEKAKRKS